jgi:hypothetical protein
MFQKKAWVFFRLLTNKYFPDKLEHLGKILPKEEFEEVSACSYTVKEPKILLFHPDAWIQGFHFSWLEPSLQLFPPALCKNIVQNLFPRPTEREAGNLQEETTPVYPDAVRQFLISYLYKHFPEKEPLPKALSHDTPFAPLLLCSIAELQQCIDFLSLFDMVEEVRRTVDKRLLQMVFQLLTKEEQQYLKTLLRQKPKIAPPPLNLPLLIKDAKKFQMTRIRQALEKLALALSGQEADVIWHITHMLDKTHAKFLQDRIATQAIEHTTNIARQQVLQTLQFLKSKRAP